ncbi:MAG: hypothetical protein O3C40_19200 [Planctomycetota bacterium]|nr:hypothetical protein [Planctomycetota bacterium]
MTCNMESDWERMHARELVEFAAVLASNGPAIIGHAERLADSGLEQYWSASRCRQERWARSLKTFSYELQYANAKEMATRWEAIRHVLEEILTTEVLTRTWGAVCCGHEQQRGLDEASPVVRNVLACHLEARNRALNLMVYGHGLRVEEAVILNRMRRRNERWNDLLLGYLPNTADVAEFAFSAARVKEFAADRRASASPETAWSLLVASLRIAYQRQTCATSPNEDLNRRVAAGILACLPGELFESTGTIKSLWLLRMQHAASDTQGMIEQLIALENTPVDQPVWEGRAADVRRTRGSL